MYGDRIHLRVVPDGLVGGPQVQAGARCGGRHRAGAGWLLLEHVSMWVLKLLRLCGVLSHGWTDGNLLPRCCWKFLAQARSGLW